MMQTALDPVSGTVTYEYYINQLMVRILSALCTRNNIRCHLENCRANTVSVLQVFTTVTRH